MATLEYDVVVVGAGSSGCVMASRLARAGLKVLVVETGPADAGSHPGALWPGKWFTAGGYGAPISEPFMTEPQSGMNGRNMFAWRGRGGGGSSVVNASLYLRGRKDEYEKHWPWHLEEVEASFKSVELELSLEPTEAAGPLGRSIKAMLDQAGFADASGGDAPWTEDGIQPRVQCTALPGGKRKTAWQAFINPVLTLPNLTIMDDAQVTRLLIEGGKAVGLEVLRKGAAAVSPLRLAKAEAEVVVCAGTFAGPQLLMLSGIGPSEHLEEKGVKVVQHSPHVGQNLQDHLILVAASASKKKIGPADCTPLGINWMAHWATAKGGARVGLITGDSWDLPNKFVKATLIPHMKPGLLPALLRAALFPLLWLLACLPAFQNLLQQTLGFSLFLTSVKSRGTVRLRSGKASAAPLIDPGYLTDEDDLEAMWEGWQRLRRVYDTPEAAERLGMEIHPGSMYGNAKDKESFAAWAKDMAIPFFHPVGTCRMGKEVEDSVVSDKTLKVHGVEGLRVADASVAPHIPSAPTQAMAMMVGDFAASLILRERFAHDEDPAKAQLLQEGLVTGT